MAPFPPALLAQTADGYGVGLEWLVYASFLLPVVFLAFVWFLGNRRIV